MIIHLYRAKPYNAPVLVVQRVSAVQSREHLFKECVAWKQEIRLLWSGVVRRGQFGQKICRRVIERAL